MIDLVVVITMMTMLMVMVMIMMTIRMMLGEFARLERGRDLSRR